MVRDLGSRRSEVDGVAGGDGSPEQRGGLVSLVSRWRASKWVPEETVPETKAAEGKAGLKDWLLGLKYDVDHKRSLAAHWIAKGWNTDDETRREAAFDMENLELLDRSANRSKGSGEGRERYDRLIGPEFTSKYAEGGLRDARTIDGEWFCSDREGTKPIDESDR